MMNEDKKQERFLHAPEMSDQTIAKAFEGTNFGRSDYREFLAYSVLKKVCGWHCGWTITTIMVELGLITPKHHKVTKLGRMFLSDSYKDPYTLHTAPIEPICATGGAEWVKCTPETMPLDGQEVIVMDVERGKVQSGMVNRDGVFSDFNEDYYHVNNPSHWMPLPAAPED